MRYAVRLRVLLGALIAMLVATSLVAVNAKAELLPEPVGELLEGAAPPVEVPDVPAVTGGGQAVAAPAGDKAVVDQGRVWGDLYPAFPGDIVVKQPDGSTFRAKLTNAEIGGAMEADGYTIVKRSDGWWTYASGRRGSDLVATAARVGLDAVPRGLALGVGRTRNLWLDAQGGDMRAQAFRQLQIASWKASQAAAAEGGPRVFRFPVLMLATWWDEEAGQTEPQFQEGNTAEAFKELLDGFGGNPTGTVTEFYFESSFGQFLVQVDVFGPYTSQRSRQDRCYYGGIDPPADPFDDLDPIDTALGIGGAGAVGMAVEAVPQADADVDFSQYDNDGDGFVDFTAVLHSGPDMAATGDPCHTWSHAIEAGLAGPLVEETVGLPHNSLQHGIPTTDGVMVNRLFTMPEIDLEIGVAAHEMAHALGEPDYYNPNYTSMGTGDWDMMAGGSWFGNPPGSNPTGFQPASRIFQGWITPRIVDRDVPNLTLQPRELQPSRGYKVGTPNPNIVLVPVKTIAVGETDELGHTWTEDDTYGLAKHGDRFVVEGYFLENWSRSVNAPPFDPKMKRQPYFDRQALGSGLMVWHFDYVRRSNVYFGSNDAGADPNRPQMDPVEFDFNDNTQELQLGLTRGEPQDLITAAATGITSGTRQLPAGIPDVDGTPQEEITFSGVTPPTQHFDHEFEVEANPANYQMRVSVTGAGDCKLQLLHEGKPVGGEVDSGFVGAEEFIDVTQPKPGTWTARVGDFAGCLQHEGTVTFSKPGDVFDTKGAGDTWSNWTEKPTGWAFTNVRPSDGEGFVNALDAAGRHALTLDVLKLGADATDVSPGFVTPGDVDAGRANRMSVPIFNNGGKAVPAVDVVVRRGSASGPVVTRGTLRDLAPYKRKAFTFAYTPPSEGPVALVVTVDPAGRLGERSEANNTQRTVLEASPPGGQVLVVDDDGAADAEDSITGALASLGIPFDVVHEHADAALLRKYKAVIWESGLERYQGQLDPADRKAIQTYLDEGGRLLFTSPRAAGALGEPVGGTNPLATEDMAPFLTDYFGVAYKDTVQVGGGVVTGTGDILGRSKFRIDVFPGRPLQDVFTLAKSSKGTATPIATWDKGGEGSLMGIKTQGASFRTIFLGYNLAQSVQGAEVARVLERSLAWFGVTPGGYRSSGAVLRHTAVRSAISGTAVPIKAFTTGSAPTLRFRAHGARSWTSVRMTRTAPGVFHAVIPASVVRTNGVEYFLAAGGARDPFTADLPHYISVALPLR